MTTKPPTHLALAPCPYAYHIMWLIATSVQVLMLAMAATQNRKALPMWRLLLKIASAVKGNPLHAPTDGVECSGLQLRQWLKRFTTRVVLLNPHRGLIFCASCFSFWLLLLFLTFLKTKNCEQQRHSFF